MCCRPVHILNPKLDFTLRDKLTLDVPCGNCPECRELHHREWFVRSYFQWLHCQKSGGIALFVTWTFNEKSVPKYKLKDGTIIRCFSKRLIQLYLKRLRKFFDKLWKGTIIKYLICSELGDKRKRPHHHGILYFYPPEGFYNTYSCMPTNLLKSVVRKLWSHGIVNYGRKLINIKEQGIIQNENALFYVCKYITKDVDWDYNLKDLPKDIMPFHLQSKGFGSYILDYYGLSDFDTAFNFFVRGKIMIQGHDKPFCVPMYIQRKCLYDYIYTKRSDGSPDVKYVMNELGMKVRKQMEKDSIEEKSSNFRAVLSCCSSFVTNDERLLLLNGRCGTEFDSVDSLQEFINTHLINYDNLALYSNIFRQRIYVPISNYDSFIDESDTHTYSISDAFNYLDFIYSDAIKDLRIVCEKDHIGKNGVVTDLEIDLSKLDLRNRNVYDILSKDTYAITFPPIYELFIEIYNTLQYFGGLDKERKYYVDLNNYRNLKLLKSSTKCEDVI